MLIDFNLIFDEICQDEEAYYRLHASLHFSLSAARFDVEHAQFAPQLMDL